MSQLLKICLTVFCSLTAVAASAHTGHSENPGFMAGFLHPFTGADHLAAMLAVGVWSAMTMRRAWVAPFTFASLLWVGALVGGGFPAVESMIAASLLVVGLLLVARVKLPLSVGAAIVGLFALFHGAAHGIELGSSTTALTGMVLGTALIHAVGVVFGFFLNRRNIFWVRMVGGMVALVGLLVA